MQERLQALKRLPLANMAPAVSERLNTEEKAISLFALQQKVSLYFQASPSPPQDCHRPTLTARQRL